MYYNQNYGYPPTQPQPYQQQSPYNLMEERLRRLEALRFDKTPSYQNGNLNVVSQDNPSINTQTNTQNTFIIVNNAEDAWNYPADWTGAKQWFYNEKDNEIYSKIFDANVPTTIKDIYKKIIVAEQSKPESESIDPLSPVLDRLIGLENDIDEVKGMLRDAKWTATNNLEIPITKISRRGRPAKQSNGNSETK